MRSSLNLSLIFMLFTAMAAWGFIVGVHKNPSLANFHKIDTKRKIAFGKLKSPTQFPVSMVHLDFPRMPAQRPTAESAPIKEKIPESTTDAEYPPEPIVSQIPYTKEGLPQVKIEEKPIKEKKRFGILSLRSNFNSTNINSTDAMTGGSAQLYSSSNYTLGLEYNHMFNNMVETIFYFNSKNLQVISPAITNYLLNNRITLFSFGAGLRYWFSEQQRLGLGFTIGSDQLPFLRGLSASQVTIDQLSVSGGSASVTWNFAKPEPFVLGAESVVSLYLPTTTTSYQSALNLALQERLYVRQYLSPKFRFELGLAYGYINENTSIAKQNQTDLGIDLRLSTPLGGSFNP